MRLSELSQLQLNEVNLEEGFVLVHGKGAKDRYVPIGRSTIKCLWNYIKKRAVIDVDTNSDLFVTQRGTTLSARGVQIVFRSLKKKLNLDGRKLSPHLLRTALHWLTSKMVVIRLAYNEYWVIRIKRPPQSM